MGTSGFLLWHMVCSMSDVRCTWTLKEGQEESLCFWTGVLLGLRILIAGAYDCTQLGSDDNRQESQFANEDMKNACDLS
jgi:hypothetical protein